MEASHSMRAHPLGRQAMLFALFGVVQLGVDWAVFVSFSWAGLAVGVANMAGRVIGAVLGFLLNARYTFNSGGRSLQTQVIHGFRFALAWVLTALLSTGAVWLIARHFGLHAAWGGKLMVDGSIAVLGFLLSKYWIFR